MKRVGNFRQLSRDHHHGLVLARKARQAGAAADRASVEACWAELERSFDAELEPHFAVEEDWLGTALADAGESALVARLYAEHQALRAYRKPETGRMPADLHRFGELLDAHIRFEESELFEVAQRMLYPEAP